jgi:hypothetical protein
VVRFGVGATYPWLDPTVAGLAAAAVAFFISLNVRRPQQL